MVIERFIHAGYDAANGVDKNGVNLFVIGFRGMQVLHHRTDDGVHEIGGIFRVDILEHIMVRTLGKDLVSGEELKEVLVKIIQGVFSKKRRGPHRDDRMMLLVIILKIYVEDPRHQI